MNIGVISRVFQAFLLMTAIAAARPASAVTIDFSGHTQRSVIGTTYADLGVRFTNDAYFLQCLGGCPAPDPFGYFAYNDGNSFSAVFSSAQSLVTFQSVSSSSTLARAYNASNELVASISDDEVGYLVVSNRVNMLSGSGIVRVVFSTNGGNNGPAITNLSFDAAAAPVPEPASWALMLGGLGLIGGALRRRRHGPVSKASPRLSTGF